MTGLGRPLSCGRAEDDQTCKRHAVRFLLYSLMYFTSSSRCNGGSLWGGNAREVGLGWNGRGGWGDSGLGGRLTKKCERLMWYLQDEKNSRSLQVSASAVGREIAAVACFALLGRPEGLLRGI